MKLGNNEGTGAGGFRARVLHNRREPFGAWKIL